MKMKTKTKLVNRANGIILLLGGLAFLPVSLFMFLGSSFAAHGVTLVDRLPVALGQTQRIEVRPSQGTTAHVDVTLDLPRSKGKTDVERVGAGFPMQLSLSDLSGAVLFEENVVLRLETPRVSVYKPREAPETARLAWRAQWLTVPAEGFVFTVRVDPSVNHPELKAASAMVYGEPKLSWRIRMLPIFGLLLLISGVAVLLLSRRSATASA